MSSFMTSAPVVEETSHGIANWVIGVILACAASVISNLGINLQKLTHLKGVRGVSSGFESPTAPTTASALSDINQSKYYLQPLWVLGIALVILGAVADFFALAFAPQVVIAPLGSVTLIANCFFAPVLLGEKINHIEYTAVLVIITGSIVSVWFASHDDTMFTLDELFELYTRPPFLFFAVVIMAIICVMLSALQHYNKLREDAIAQANSAAMFLMDEGESKGDSMRVGHATPHDRFDYAGASGHAPTAAERGRQWTPSMSAYNNDAMKMHRFLFPALSGIIGAQNVLFAKCTAELMYGSIAGGKMLFAYLPTYIVLFALGITIFFQIKYLNDGLKIFEASYVVPVFQTFWCTGSVASGLIFFVR